MAFKSYLANNVVFFYLCVLTQVLAFTMELGYAPLFVNAFLVLCFCDGNVLRQKDKDASLLFFAFLVGLTFFFAKGCCNVFGLLPSFLVIFIPYLGYLYVKNHKVNLRIFDYILIAEYIFFHAVYFSILDTAKMNDGDLFGHSSSNTISMCLNMTLFSYFILNKYYKERRHKTIVVFGVINVVLIIIQESRAGLLVSVILLLLIIIDMVNKASKKTMKMMLMFVLVAVIGFALMKSASTIEEYLTMIGVTNDTEYYEDEARVLAQSAFFSELSFTRAIIGFPANYMFEGFDRTFNAFLDMWFRYGIVPLVVFIILLFKRIKERDLFYIPLYYYTPLLAYSFFESFIFFSQWDWVLYLMLFLGKKDNYNNNNLIPNTICY